MKPSIADTARAYLLPVVATVCTAQVAMLLAILLLEVPESVFQGTTFRCGIALAAVVSIVSLRRRAGRAFGAAKRSGDVKLQPVSLSGDRNAEYVDSCVTDATASRAPYGTDTAMTAAPREAMSYVSVAASCPERTLVVLYLQFRRLPFAIESRERRYGSAMGQHA